MSLAAFILSSPAARTYCSLITKAKWLSQLKIVPLQCNDFIGSVENVQDCKTWEVNPAYLQAIDQQWENARPRQTLSAKKRQFIEENIKLQVHEQFCQKYLNLLLKNHKAISQDNAWNSIKNIGTNLRETI